MFNKTLIQIGEIKALAFVFTILMLIIFCAVFSGCGANNPVVVADNTNPHFVDTSKIKKLDFSTIKDGVPTNYSEFAKQYKDEGEEDETD